VGKKRFGFQRGTHLGKKFHDLGQPGDFQGTQRFMLEKTKENGQVDDRGNFVQTALKRGRTLRAVLKESMGLVGVQGSKTENIIKGVCKQSTDRGATKQVFKSKR